MNFTDLKKGDKIPQRNRVIKEIIGEDKHYIVYLDDKDIICWDCDETHNSSGSEFGNIENQISFWESNCNRIFSRKESFDYKCLLAEGYVRMLDSGDIKSASRIIKNTSDRIKVEGEQILRQNYLLASFGASCLVVLLLITFVILKNQIKSKNIYEIFITGFMGGIGGFIFSMIRASNYKPILAYGKRVHRIDGYLRIIYGLIGGAIVAIGVKSNMIFGFINSEPANLYSLYFLGAISGASETLLPYIIKQSDKIYSDKLTQQEKKEDKAVKESRKTNRKAKKVT